jgi:hypothetical protein
LFEQVWVESDGSEKLEADIPSGCTDSLFRKSPASGKAEERTFFMIHPLWLDGDINDDADEKLMP